MRTGSHFEIQDGGRKGAFQACTAPQKFCLLLIWTCTKFHAFIKKCTIFFHISALLYRKFAILLPGICDSINFTPRDMGYCVQYFVYFQGYWVFRKTNLNISFSRDI